MGRNVNKVRNGLADISSCASNVTDLSNKILEYGTAIVATGESSSANSLVVNTLESIDNIVQLLNSASDSLNNTGAHNNLLNEAIAKDIAEAIKLATNTANASKSETESKDNSQKLLPPNKFKANAFAEKY